MLDNDSLIQNGAKEKEDDLFSTSMEHSGDKATSKKKTKSGLSLMDLVQDGESKIELHLLLHVNSKRRMV